MTKPIADRPQHDPQTPQADGGTPAAAGGSAPEQDVPSSDGGAKEPGGSTSPAASEAHAPPSTTTVVIAPLASVIRALLDNAPAVPDDAESSDRMDCDVGWIATAVGVLEELGSDPVAPLPTPQQVIAAADLEYRLAEAFHDRRCAYGTACHDRAAHVMWPHGEDARALAPFVAQLLAEQSDTAAPLALQRERLTETLLAEWMRSVDARVLTSPRGHCERLADAVLATAVGGITGEQHVYLSTACLHGQCAYCECRTGIEGQPKKPGECKFCTAKCIHHCHSEDDGGEQR